MDEKNSIFGMAQMGDDGVLPVMPLCELVEFEVNSGFRGRVSVRVTFRAVARARLRNLTQLKPVMAGIVTELLDEGTADITAANELVDNVENLLHGFTQNGETPSVNPQQCYKKACELALETNTQGYLTTSQAKLGQRSVSELAAASWAVFATCSDTNLYTALAMTNLTDRLQFGLDTLLHEKNTRNKDSYKTEDDLGFE
jgi:hypothetical protein